MSTTSPTDLEFDKVLVLTEGMASDALTLAPIDGSIDAWALLQGRERPRSPVRFRPHVGSRPGDLVGGGHAALKLVSDRLKERWEQASLTGWATYDVEVEGLDGPGYHGLRVTGRCGPLTDEQSERVLIPPKSPEGKGVLGWRGLYFDAETWDGSDVFLPEGTAWIFVTERVKQAAKGLTNLAFRRVTEVERRVL